MKTLADTMRVWNIFEKNVNNGRVKQLGISNIYELEYL